jgi:vacuolar iron transporter family protein
MKEKTLLQQHLESDHRHTIFNGYLKEMVYGGIDGIITTFAVVASFTGVTALSGDMSAIPVMLVLVFGLANLFADAFSMGVGDYLSSRAKNKLFEKERAKEVSEIEENIDFEIRETIEILQDRGFSQEDAKQLTEIYARNGDFWVDFMMRYELDMSKPNAHPFIGALVTFGSFIVFGAIPLVPYMVTISSSDGRFFAASIFAAIALTFLGVIRSRFTRESMILSVIEIMGLGMFAAFIAYFVGTLFA